LSVQVSATPDGGPDTGPATLTASSAVSLTWTVHANTSPATHLRIERAADSGFTSQVGSILVNPALRTFTDNNVGLGRGTYYSRVQAQGKISDSAWSNVASIPWTAWFGFRPEHAGNRQ
jgi:hypothetical protein